MILADSSIWIDHLKLDNPNLVRLLDDRRVVMHPFVIGEIALGRIRQRNVVLQTLRDLPQADVAMDHEVLEFITRHELFGRGIGYVDAHLLAAAKLMAGVRIWTRDKRLFAVAEGMTLAFTPDSL